MKKDREPVSSVLTDRMDVGSEEFKEFQTLLLEKSKQQTRGQRTELGLKGLQFSMEDYLQSEETGNYIPVGDFLKSCLRILNVRQNRFANYIGMKPSNLSKLMNEERPISGEMALILGKIFKFDPMLWLKVQSKNELKKLANQKQGNLIQYSLEGLMEENLV